MNIVNLNQFCKIVLVKKEKTEDVWVVEKSANIAEWFKNLFRKNKIKKKYLLYRYNYPKEYSSMEELDDFLKKHDIYTYNPNVSKFYEKAHVTLWYSDYRHGNETKYFETDKEAKEYFNKLLAYAKQYDVPFIDIKSEK